MTDMAESGDVTRSLRSRAGKQHDKNSNVTSPPGVTSRSAEEASPASQRVLYVIFLALLIDLLAFTVILPLLPSLLDFYGQQGHKDPLYSTLLSWVRRFGALVGAPDTPRWHSVLFGGLIGSLFSFLQFLSSPLIGAASDVYGRKPMFLLSQAGVALSYVLWALSSSFSVFVLSRVVGGVSRGNVSLGTAVVADVAPPERRGKGMALIGVAFSLGFLIGPSLGAAFSKHMRVTEQINASGGKLTAHTVMTGESQFYLYPAVFAICMATADLLFMLVALRETLPPHRRSPSLSSGFSDALLLIKPTALFRFASVRNMSEKDLSSLRSIGVVYFLYMLTYSGLEFTLTFLVYNRFDYTRMEQGRMFFVMGAVMIIIQGGFVRRLKHGSELSLALRGTVMLIPAFAIIGVAFQTILIFIGIFLFSCASATVVPCLTTIVSGFGSVEQKGRVMGIFRSLGALARASGPILASTVYWCFGAVVCYLSGAVFLFLPLYLLSKVKLTPKEKVSSSD